MIVTRLGEAPGAAETGEIGRSLAQTFELPGLRLRLVEYEAGYLADHWCDRSIALRKGACFVVSDHGDASHRIRTVSGGKAFIVD